MGFLPAGRDTLQQYELLQDNRPTGHTRDALIGVQDHGLFCEGDFSPRYGVPNEYQTDLVLPFDGVILGHRKKT